MPAQQPLEAVDVHRLVQAVVDRLAHQRMIGNLALARRFSAQATWSGNTAAEQILGIHARELRRHLLAAAEARQGERDARDPAPARREHRRVEQRLDQHRLARVFECR